ncbi:type VII secretion-associated serine protease mycosin [Actinoplanes tereljensis]
MAVVDTGVDAHHPDLAGRVRAGADFTGDASDGRVDRSSNGHGTSVAGIIAGSGTGPDHINGLAPDATILPVRISDTLAGDPAAVAQGIYYAATHGATVINVSICTTVPDPQIRSAVDDALRRDIVVIAAAGNDGLTANPPQFPAALPGVVAVAASDTAGNRWPKSESGPYLGLTAPGVDIYTAGIQGSHQQSTGTSFAAPHVAATAALLRSRYPQENASQIIGRLTATARHADTGRSAQWGFGIIDPYRALTAPPGSPTASNPLLQPLADTKPPASGPAGRPAWIWPTVGAAIAVAAASTVFAVRRRRGARSKR